MPRLLRTTLQISMGLLVAITVVWLAVLIESVTRPSLEWGFIGTFQLGVVPASLAYLTGASLVVVAFRLSGATGMFTTGTFLCLGALAPLFYLTFINLPILGGYLDRLPWAVAPPLSGAVSALTVFLASMLRDSHSLRTP